MRLIIVFSQFFLHVLGHMVNEILRAEGSRQEEKMERTTDSKLFSREGFTVDGHSLEEIEIIGIQALQVIEEVLKSFHLCQLVKIVPVIRGYFWWARQYLLKTFRL